jgi:hypothetical protein
MPNLKTAFIVGLMMNAYIAFTQSNDNQPTKTSEFVGNLKRRDIYYDDNMNVVKEEYYSRDKQQIVNTLIYNNQNQLKTLIGFINYPEKSFSIDLEKGEYKFSNESLELKFKNWFVFNGIQKDRNTVLKYLNGNKNGRLIQTDSGFIVSNGSVNRIALHQGQKFNIYEFYSQIEDELPFRLFNGISLNFSHNLLNGSQIEYRKNGKERFFSVFKNGFVNKYSSFSQDGSVISKIVADSNNIISNPYILNGVLKNEELGDFKFYNATLSRTGDILKYNDFSYYPETGYQGVAYRHVTDWNTYERIIKDYFDQSVENQIRSLVEKDKGIIAPPAEFDNDVTLRVSDGENKIKDTKSKEYYKNKLDQFSLWKRKFDESKIMITENNPHVLRVLAQIPYYYIEKYKLGNNDDNNLLKSSSKNDNLKPKLIGHIEGKDSNQSEEDVYTKVEVDAEFPGGSLGWTRYVTREIERNIDEIVKDGKSGTVVVLFIVDREGNVSEVRALDCTEAGVERCLGPGTKLAEIAVNAIRKGPKWTPAMLNGRKVKAYRRQPVTFMLAEE